MMLTIPRDRSLCSMPPTLPPHRRSRRDVLPRLASAFLKSKTPDADADGIVPLGRVERRPLAVAMRGATVLLGWGDGVLASGLAALNEPAQSSGAALRADWGDTPPQRHWFHLAGTLAITRCSRLSACPRTRRHSADPLAGTYQRRSSARRPPVGEPPRRRRAQVGGPAARSAAGTLMRNLGFSGPNLLQNTIVLKGLSCFPPVLVPGIP